MIMTREEFLDALPDVVTLQGELVKVWVNYIFDFADSNPKWKSVEDELPPENGKTQQSISVWATDGLTSGEFRYNFDTKTWTDMFGDKFDVILWMPLPPPPRNEE